MNDGSPTWNRTKVLGFGDRYTNHCAMRLYASPYRGERISDVLFMLSGTVFSATFSMMTSRVFSLERLQVHQIPVTKATTTRRVVGSFASSAGRLYPR